MLKSEKEVGALIRERRSRRGLSVQDLAERASVTKSYLSMIESGRRVPTVEQLSIFCRELDLPEELLRLNAGRIPDDVRDALADSAASVTALVRQDKEQLAIAFPTSLDCEIDSLANPERAVEIRSSFTGDIVVGKNTTSYRAHSYHTKVPPEAIEPLVLHFTQPGGLVVDSFCGSGMTGVAALRTGRNAILSDLSPAAVHIARNYTQPCDARALEEAGRRIWNEVRGTIAWLYQIVDSHGERTTVEYTTWSDKFACPSCGSNWTYWDVVQKHNETLDSQSIPCPSCNATSRKQDLLWLGEIPVVSTISKDGSRLLEHRNPTAEDLSLIADAENSQIPYWIPRVPFNENREMWRASHRTMGVVSVADFYSRRNLHALAAIRHSILKEPDERLRSALLFAFTAMVNRASRRYQWNAKRPTNVMTGTLYISSLRYEWNVWSLFSRKLRDVIRYFEEFPTKTARCETLIASATQLNHLPDNCADFAFLDPPFGSNIFYADSSLLWEAWLGQLTEDTAELVVNKHLGSNQGGKSLEEYRNGMTLAFSEARRVLKAGAHAAVLFSNTDGNVWQAVQSSIEEAGFEVASTHLLDKTHRSIKGVKGELGKEDVTRRDIVICLRQKTKVGVTLRTELTADIESRIDGAVETFLKVAPNATFTTDEIYSNVVKNFVADHVPLQGVTMSSVESSLRTIATRTTEGKWQLSRNGSASYVPVGSKYGVVVDDYVLKDSQVAVERSRKGAARCSIDFAPRFGQVDGARNTALYNAHSYHTKVPPEAIAPFIEHFTNLGDVVLDPFAGSGMTGVAAAIAGRQAILNDLSVASAHLAYNHTRECDAEALAEAFETLYRKLKPRFADIYRTKHSSKVDGYVQWTLWSKVYRCPGCRKQFSLWDVIDIESGRVGQTIDCPKCGSTLQRRKLKAINNVPVSIYYEAEDGDRLYRFQKQATAADVGFINSFCKDDIKNWYPRVPISDEREMYIRCALHLQDINDVSDFYTPRNLLALSMLWAEIQKTKEARIRHALEFAFTNTAWHGTKMRRYNARGGQRPLTGTLYVPQLSSEVNVLEVFANKIGQLKSYYDAFRPRAGTPAPHLILGSATNLKQIEAGSVDYIFTDPPFGSNLFYADCNLIWESWLGALTDATLEAVVNRSLRPQNGGKTLDEYQHLMTESLKEMHRVLKDKGWVTLVFHNTDPAVWRAIQDAAEAAGFELHDADSLARKQQSHKGYKGRSGEENVAHFDVVMNLRKRAIPACIPMLKVGDDILLSAIDKVMEEADSRDKGFQWIHSTVVKHLVTGGFDLGTVSYERVRRLWESKTKRRNRWGR